MSQDNEPSNLGFRTRLISLALTRLNCNKYLINKGNRTCTCIRVFLCSRWPWSTYLKWERGEHEIRDWTRGMNSIMHIAPNFWCQTENKSDHKKRPATFSTRNGTPNDRFFHPSLKVGVRWQGEVRSWALLLPVCLSVSYPFVNTSKVSISRGR